MGKLAERLRTNHLAREAQANERFNAAMKRGPKTDGDFDKLLDAAAKSGKSEAEIAHDIAIVEEVASLNELSDQVPKLVKARWAADQAYKDAQENYETVTAAAEAKCYEALRASYAAIAQSDQTETALAKRQALQHKHPVLLATEPVDLDQHTIHCHGMVLNPNDFRAPVWNVDPDVYAEQGARRTAMLDKAEKQERDAHVARFEKWEARYLAKGLSRQNTLAQLEKVAGKAPVLVLPTWADVIKRKG